MINLKEIENLIPEEIKNSNLEWRYIKEFPMYICSENGDIVSLKKVISRYNKKETKKAFILKQSKNNYGYNFVGLHNKSIVKYLPIHVIVAQTFIRYREKGEVIDHIDNNKLNNHFSNLQIITIRYNLSKDKKNKTSKFTGVSWDKLNKKWTASIYIKGKIKKLGLFVNEHEAHDVYQKEKNLLV